MLSNLKVHRTLWAVVGLAAAIAGFGGVFTRGGIYEGLAAPQTIVAAYGQDWMSLAVGLLLVALAIGVRERHSKLQAVALGLLAYVFYAYGIYVIEQTYNGLYLLYMLAFGLSFWALAYAVVSLKTAALEAIQIPNGIRVFSAVVALLQPAVFYPKWIAALLPLMRDRLKIENAYSIYVVDLCFVMPAFLIVAFLLLKKRPIGYLLAPTLFILGFTILFPLALSELAKPSFGLPISVPELAGPLALSLLFLGTTALHLKNVRTTGQPQARS